LRSRSRSNDFQVFGYVYVSLTTASVKAGYGKHTAALDPDESSRAVMLNFAGFAPGVLSFVTPKLAVVALLTRIMNPSGRTKIFLWALTCVSGLFIVGCVIILYAQCDPPKALWDSTVENPKCWDPTILVDYSIFAGGGLTPSTYQRDGKLIRAALSGFVDLYLAVYPATVLWKLKINIKKKIGLSVALGLGLW